VVDGMVADFAIVVARAGDRVGLFLSELDSRGTTRQPSSSIDPTRPLACISMDGAAAEPLGESGTDWTMLRRILDRAAVLMAFEQVGGADAALIKARQYALDRYAFGRPIGSFQAIKHKLADVYTVNELARSNAYYGAWALETNSVELARAAATARVSATEAFELAARELIQVHGGIAVTWAHDCHLYYRRSRHLSLELGSLSLWRDRLAAQIIAKHVS
jgi:acyl-CoA dehydrogenase